MRKIAFVVNNSRADCWQGVPPKSGPGAPVWRNTAPTAPPAQPHFISTALHPNQKQLSFFTFIVQEKRKPLLQTMNGKHLV